jgi:hypothetical protein
MPSIRRYKTCNVTVEPTDKDKIDKIAKDNDLKRSQVVRRLLSHSLKNKSILARLFPR